MFEVRGRKLEDLLLRTKTPELVSGSIIKGALVFLLFN
jgi:hypothetical protein